MNPDDLEVCLDKVSGSEFFDEIRVGRFSRISFHRTLRIPEDGHDYPLPASLGRFPIHRIEDYAEKVPAKWLDDGGFFIPLYQKEALFLQFDGPQWHPTIGKVCVGKINAISGKSYSEELSKNQQDYIVIPNQRWLDGICSGEGLVKQFVAMPLGQGYTIEAQITDEEKFGGFQIVVYDSVNGRFPERDPELDKELWKFETHRNSLFASSLPHCIKDAEDYVSMGVAAGGSIKQQIRRDTYGIESWNPEKKRHLTIHLVNSLAYKAITDMEPPSSPITATAYQRAKIPWYSHYDETAPVIKPPSILKGILGISAIGKKRGEGPPDDQFKRYVAIQNIQKIRTPDKHEASNSFRERAHESRSKEWWENAIREISYVIDLDADVCAEDFALRSCCNFQLGRFRDGVIDGMMGLGKNRNCVEALSWRAFCRKALGDHEGLREDANRLVEIPETELVGLELKAEAALLAERYDDAFNEAMDLKAKNPCHLRANQIISEVNTKLYGSQIPADRITAMIEVAKKYIAEGVSSPEDFAARLHGIASGKLKPYTKALWGAFMIVDPETRDAAPNWHGIYSQQANPAGASFPAETPPASASVAHIRHSQTPRKTDRR